MCYVKLFCKFSRSIFRLCHQTNILFFMLWMIEIVTDRIPLCVVLLSSLSFSFSRSPSYSKNEISKPARKLLLSQYQKFDTWVLRGTCILHRGVLGVMWHNILEWLWAGLFAITQSWACIVWGAHSSVDTCSCMPLPRVISKKV